MRLSAIMRYIIPTVIDVIAFNTSENVLDLRYYKLALFPHTKSYVCEGGNNRNVTFLLKLAKEVNLPSSTSS